MTNIERMDGNDKRYEYRILLLTNRTEHMQKLKVAALATHNEIVPVTTIKQAMDFLDTRDHVDVVIAEAFLFDESAFDFLKALRAAPMHKDVPIFLIAAEPTAFASRLASSLELMAETLGAYKFLYMPKFDTDQLMREVGAVLPLKREPMKELSPEGAY